MNWIRGNVSVKQLTFQNWNENHIGWFASSKPSPGLCRKAFISSQPIEWSQVTFHHTCYTFPGVPHSSVSVRKRCVLPHMWHDHTHSLCRGRCVRVGLECPAALSMCACVCLQAFAYSLFKCLPFCPIKNACYSSVSMHVLRKTESINWEFLFLSCAQGPSIGSVHCMAFTKQLFTRF